MFYWCKKLFYICLYCYRISIYLYRYSLRVYKFWSKSCFYYSRIICFFFLKSWNDSLFSIRLYSIFYFFSTCSIENFYKTYNCLFVKYISDLLSFDFYADRILELNSFLLIIIWKEFSDDDIWLLFFISDCC